jgi:hypothetical protein
MTLHPMIANQGINQGVIKGMTNVEISRDVRGGNHNTIGFPGLVGVSFKHLMSFPILLPFGFGTEGFVFCGLGWSGCSHGFGQDGQF